MTITATTNLSLPLITTGTESGTWGDVVDNGLTSYLDIAIAGGLSISITTADVTLTNTAGTSSSTNLGSTSAQYAILNITGAKTAARNLILPGVSKIYVINNAAATGGFNLTVKASGTSGITMADGEKAVVIWNGSDYVKVVSSINQVPNGGTGLVTLAAGRIPYGAGTAPFGNTDNLSYDGTTLRVGSNALLGGATNPIVGMTGSQNNYIQSYVYNAAVQGSASSDFVAYTDKSTDAHGWADLGYTSSVYSDSVYTVTGPNEAYLFASAPYAATPTVTGNAVYATDSTGTQNYHQWYVGGFTQAKSAWKMQLTPTGLQLANALGGAYGGTGLTSPGAAGNALISDGTNWTSAANPTSKIQPISASVASNALTISASTLGLDFRSTTLGSGTVTTVSGTPSNLVVPSGATLGTANGSPLIWRFVILALNNAGTLELAVSNIAGGTDLTETGLITTNAIAATSSFTGTIAVTTGILTLNSTATGTFALGQAISGTGITSGTYIKTLLTGSLGASGSTYQTNQFTAVSLTTITGVAGMGVYSTTARTSLAYRVLGYIDTSQAVAGLWSNAPSTIQGVGGQALTAMSSLGYSQSWQSLLGSRFLNTTYYNTTGRPICLYTWNNLGASGGNTVYINGVDSVGFGSSYASASNQTWPIFIIIPPGATYYVTMANGGPAAWYELR